MLCWPGDNLMIHAAVEQAKPGDIIVITTTSPSCDGAFGELLATSLASRGVRGLIMGAGLRDTQELRDMGFPAWTAHVSAQGTVKETPGSVNVPVTLGGQMIRPGDAIVADDDGVCVVPRLDVAARGHRVRRRGSPRRTPAASSSPTACSALTCTTCAPSWPGSTTSATPSTSGARARAHERRRPV